MSDNTGDESFFRRLINLISYKINNAISDPNADEYAAEIARKREERLRQEAARNNTTVNTTTSDPNQFIIKRFLYEVMNETTKIIKMIFFPFIALMLAMIVANDMFVYSIPIRIIFFIFTFLVCFFAPPLSIILGFIYLLKGGYSYYTNNMTGRTDKVIIMPTIYTLLPISMHKPQSSLFKFFYYPFTYPKSDISAAEIPKTMEAYWKNLNESFKELDKIKNLPIFSEQLKKLETKLIKNLHYSSKFYSTLPPNVEAPTVSTILPTIVPTIEPTIVPIESVEPPAYNESKAPKPLIPRNSSLEVKLGGGIK